MRTTKRFILYCFYCVIGCFSKHSEVYGASNPYSDQCIRMPDVSKCKTVTYNDDCIYDQMPAYEECVTGAATEHVVPGASYSALSEFHACYGNLSMDNAKNCTVSCKWACAYKCNPGYWGVTKIYGVDAGIDLSSTNTAWCNKCPTYGICNGGNYFTCDGTKYSPNRENNTCDLLCTTVWGARTCEGDQVTDCQEGFYEHNDQCIECRPWEVCPGGDDNGGITECKNYWTSGGIVCDNYTGTGNYCKRFYLHTANFQSCQPCPTNATCTDNWEMSCNSGYYRTSTSGSGASTSTGSGGTPMAIYHYHWYECKACPTHGTCYNNELQECEAGWYVKGNSCLACPAHSKNCTAESFSCENGYFKDGDACSACPVGAATCTSDTYATSCVDGYWLNTTNHTCVACTGNAATCNANGALTCKGTYYVSNGKCMSCPDNASCSSNGTVTCNKNFWWYDNSSCRACPTNAVGCDHTGFYCASNTYKTSTTCEVCSAGAATCNANGALTCEDGYWLSNKTCKQCPTNYKTCSGDSFTCKDGYYKGGDACSKCTGAGTATCNANGALTCKTNYYKSNGTCVECPKNATCGGDGFTCHDGYYKKDGLCSKCTGVGWETCTADMVLKCASGYCRIGDKLCSQIPEKTICQYSFDDWSKCNAQNTNCPTGRIWCNDNCWYDATYGGIYSCDGATDDCGGVYSGTCISGYYREANTCQACPSISGSGYNYNSRKSQSNSGVSDCFFFEDDVLQDNIGYFNFSNCNAAVPISGYTYQVCCVSGGSGCVESAKQWIIGNGDQGIYYTGQDLN